MLRADTRVLAAIGLLFIVQSSEGKVQIVRNFLLENSPTNC